MGDNPEIDPTSEFEYYVPPGRQHLDKLHRPPFEDIDHELRWHIHCQAYRNVRPKSGTRWQNDEDLLLSVYEGHIDTFTRNEFTVAGITNQGTIQTLTTYLFDDRDFGDRIANHTLSSYGYVPRTK